MIRYHYVLTIQYYDLTGTMNTQTYDGDAYLKPHMSEQERYEYLHASIKKRLRVLGDVAVLFYRCVPDPEKEVYWCGFPGCPGHSSLSESSCS